MNSSLSNKMFSSLEAEQAVLGSLLIDNAKWKGLVNNGVTKDDFFTIEHQTVFEIITEFAKNNEPFDMVTVDAIFKNKGINNETKGDIVFALANNTPTADNINTYINIVKEKSRTRKLLILIKNIKELLESGKNIDEIIKTKKKEFEALERNSCKFLPIKDVCLSYQDLLIADISKRENILVWLPCGGLIMLFSQRGLGKTFFALSFAYAVTSLDQFMIWKIEKNIGCLYIDGEMSLSEMRERLMRITKTTPKHPLQLLSHETFYNKFERDLVITDHDVQQAILNLLDENKEIGLLIIDNISSLSRVREDKSDDWREFMLPFLIACRRRSVAVFLVHHASKSGDQRGTGAREDALDTVIKLEKKDLSNNEGANFTIKFGKTRSFCGTNAQSLNAKLIEKDTNLVWEVCTEEETTKNQMVELIRDVGVEGIHAKDIAEELGITPAMVSKHKKSLEEDGIIEKSRGKNPLKLKAS